jgi:FkbM family methyltransferase
MNDNINTEQKNMEFDHLGIQRANLFKLKLSRFSETKNSNILLEILRNILNFILFFPRMIIRTRRKNYINNYYDTHSSDIEKLLKIVTDEASKEVIKTQIDFIRNYDYSGHYNYLKKSGLLSKHISILDKNEYFPNGVIKLTESEKFVDGGGFNGDTVREFVKRTNNKFAHIFSFEPDSKNYSDLLAEVKNLHLTPNQITCYPKGLYSKNKTVSFSQKGIGSSISEGGTEIVEVVSLDSFLRESEINGITYIKLDVEGSELEALKGMQNIIIKNKPKLAICVYHQMKDFWEIPYFIESLDLDYKIYFRQHCLGRTDTICYAV